MEIVYLETTISSYLVAHPSRDLILAAHQELTREWWEAERGRYPCFVSAEVLHEASMGDAEMSRQRLAVMAGLPVVAITSQIESMAAQFLESVALPAEMRSDALHLAAASWRARIICSLGIADTWPMPRFFAGWRVERNGWDGICRRFAPRWNWWEARPYEAESVTA